MPEPGYPAVPEPGALPTGLLHFQARSLVNA